MPRKVAINEAIELAKTFGGDSSESLLTAFLERFTARWALTMTTKKNANRKIYGREACRSGRV